MLKKLEWSSCDGCTITENHGGNYCPVCGESKTEWDEIDEEFAPNCHTADCELGNLLIRFDSDDC